MQDDDRIQKLLNSSGPCKQCGKQGQYIGGYVGDHGEDVPEFLCNSCEDDVDVLVRVSSVLTRH